MNARHIGWFVVTTGMITALPLIFEVSGTLNVTMHHTDKARNSVQCRMFVDEYNKYLIAVRILCKHDCYAY